MPDPSDLWAGGRTFVDQRGLVADSDVDSVMAVVRSLGSTAARFRIVLGGAGFVDKLLGGVGLRRGIDTPPECVLGTRRFRGRDHPNRWWLEQR